MTTLRRLLSFALLTAGLAACGSSPPPPPDDASTEAATDSNDKPSGLSIESEVGALDEEKVSATFQSASTDLSKCFAQGAKRLPYLAGMVRFEIRVDQGGRARAVMLKDSSLGDLDTERCMIQVLEQASWPSPEGGREGIAENEFAFDPAGDTRPPVDWSEAELGEELTTARADLSACRSSAGTGPLKATLYVGTDGTPKAAGASFTDENGRQAAQCVVDKLLGITFPSPGSYASKVSFVID